MKNNTQSTYVKPRPTTPRSGRRISELKTEIFTLRYNLKRLEEELAWLEVSND